MTSVSDNVKSVMDRISSAALSCGRRAEDITLVAASKMNGYDALREAYDSGIRVFGENRVQELLEKQKLGAYEGAELHFIGHLQRNKVKNIVGSVSLIHSVDSIPLLSEIERRAASLNLVQDILLELNLAGEEQKSGFPAPLLPDMLDFASQCPHILVRGLMTVPPICENTENNAPVFDLLRQLFVDNSNKKYDNVRMDFLSMGMSGDFETAIAHGANMVRIGSALFGPRNYAISEVPADGIYG